MVDQFEKQVKSLQQSKEEVEKEKPVAENVDVELSSDDEDGLEFIVPDQAKADKLDKKENDNSNQ